MNETRRCVDRMTRRGTSWQHLLKWQQLTSAAPSTANSVERKQPWLDVHEKVQSSFSLLFFSSLIDLDHG